MNIDKHKLKSFKNKYLYLFFGVCVSVAAMAGVRAQGYPAKPIRIVVPYPPGGGTDVITRTLAQKMTEVMGQPVLVDNRPGANSIIGSDAVAKAAPDGYTVLITLATHVINPALYAKLPYGPDDHAPVTVLAEYPFVITVHPSLPVKNVKEFVAFAKARPGQLTFASSGNGSGPHLGMELFKNMAGIDVIHVPYKGAGQAMTDLLSGQVPIFLNNFLAGAQMIKAGRLRALAVTSGKRSTALPEAPTIAESGYPKFDASGWFAVFAPAKTPRPIIGKLADDFRAVLKLAEVQQGLAAQGAVAAGSSPEELGAWLRSEVERWRQVLIAANIKPD